MLVEIIGTNPISLADLKEDLSISVSDDTYDGKLQRYLKAATSLCEDLIGMDFYEKRRSQLFNYPDLPDYQSPVDLMYTPVIEIESVKLDGVVTTEYNTIRQNGGVVQVYFPRRWQTVGIDNRFMSYEVIYRSGYAENTLEEYVKIAITQLIALWFDNKIPFTETNVQAIPYGIQQILRSKKPTGVFE